MIIVFVGSRFLLPLSDHDAVICCRDFCLVQASSNRVGQREMQYEQPQTIGQVNKYLVFAAMFRTNLLF
jgi:hypothetical protein